MEDNNKKLNVPNFIDRANKTDIMGQNKKSYIDLNSNTLKSGKVVKKGSRDASISKKVKIVFATVLAAGIAYAAGKSIYNAVVISNDGTPQVVSRAGDTFTGAEGETVTADNLVRGENGNGVVYEEGKGGPLTDKDMIAHDIYVNNGLADKTKEERAEAISEFLTNQDNVNTFYDNNGTIIYDSAQQPSFEEAAKDKITGVTNADKLSEAYELTDEYLKDHDLTQNEDGSYTIGNLTK